MYSSRLVQLLILAVAALCMAQGTWFKSPRINLRALAQRADDIGTRLPSIVPGSPSPSRSSNSEASSTPTPTNSPSSPPTTKSTDTPPPSQTTPENSQTSTTPPAPTTPTPDNSHSTTSTPSNPNNTTPSPSPTGNNGGNNDGNNGGSNGGSNGGNSAHPPGTPVVSTETRVVTFTNSDGSKTTQTTTAVTTSTPELNGGDPSPNDSGMSTKTRNTIIGVVVGVGGAFVLGALGLVAFRIWGRKKHAEENDGLMDYDVDLNATEKSERGGSAGGPQRNPFQSTLENYHQPTPVNASSNF